MNERNILLVVPSRFIEGRDIAYGNITPPEYSPLNLSCLKAVLKENGYNVIILDLDFEKNFRETISELFKSTSFLLIGITVNTPLLKSAQSVANLIKELKPDVPIVVGGIHPTLLPIETAAHESFDFVVVGEGEITLLELVRAIEEKRKDLNDIDGLLFKKDGKIICTKKREQIRDLDKLPFPDRELQTGYFYKYPDTLNQNTFPIVTSRGCPGRCTFCCATCMFPKIRLRSAAHVVSEIQTLISKYGAKEIHFWDDCFTIKKKRVFEIQKLIEENDMKVKFAFPNGLRIDTIDREILIALKRMGVYSVSFGIESGNQEVLDNIKKNITLEQVEKAFSLAKEVGFETWGFFMIGLPGDTEETINDTINFAKKVDPDIAKFSILVPFPGTEAYKYLHERGLIVENDLTRYGYHSRPVYRLPTLTQDDLIRLHRKAYREFYFRPKKAFQHVLRLKSWERIKTNILTGIKVLQLILKGDKTY